MAERSWLVLADGFLEERDAKTAHGVIRYSRDTIAAILDRDHAGRDIQEVMPELNRSAPIVASVEEGLAHKPTALLLGVATPGGWLPPEWRKWILEAIDADLEIVNGLHTMLNDDPEFVEHAQKRGVRLWDVRQPPPNIPLFSGKSLEIPQRVVATVGSDCAVGKKTTAIEIANAGRASGVNTEFIATGQTGVLIAGKGIAVDRVIADFLAGAAEKLVCDAEPDSEVLIVEGQGSLWHPAYAAVTLGLLHGSAPEVLVLCHQHGRAAIEEPPFTKLPPLTEMIAVYEQMASTVRPAKVACISLNCKHLDPAQQKAAIAEVEDDTGLPVGDVWSGDGQKLWDAVATVLA
ncbi:MAG: hypothetical protein QOG04_1039 [Actinomycetota bacterium]|jgi:uncharacterized NAD-dependent epimerase/dehydratase family protein|nr:hypothetical protein [Actinomycetota bacterium]